MRLTRISRSLLIVVFCVISLPEIVLTQSAQVPIAAKNTQAIGILIQSINAMGGAAAVASIRDYTETGDITYNWASEPISASATFRGMGTANFRLDASLPAGNQTVATNGVSGTVITPEGDRQTTPFYNVQTMGSLTMPYVRASSDLTDSTTAISLIDTGATSGSYQIHFVQASPFQSATASRLTGIGQFDVFIDVTSLQIKRIVETVCSDTDINTPVTREFDFSNYQSVGQVEVPFTVSESMNGQQTWSATITSISFNGGLDASIFTP